MFKVKFLSLLLIKTLNNKTLSQNKKKIAKLYHSLIIIFFFIFQKSFSTFPQQKPGVKIKY